MFTPYILIPAIVGIICAILGYLWGKSKNPQTDGSNPSSLKADLDACRSNSKNLSAKIEKLEHEIYELEHKGSANKAMTSSSPKVAKPAKAKVKAEPKMSAPAPKVADSSFDKAGAKAAIGKPVKENDLKIVEGIGPKIAEHFNNDGIKTWQELADASIERCQSILDKAGDRYKMHNPGTWPRQAKLLAEGKWEEFKTWTDKLDGGKE